MNKAKDWTGNKKTPFVTLGASNHSEEEREENDYYATDPKALEMFLDKLKEDGIVLDNNIWECACGEGHLSKVLKNNGYNVRSTDLIDRGYKEKFYCYDFLAPIEGTEDKYIYCGDILTNPPYKYAKNFVEKGLEFIEEKNKLIMFLKIQFLESSDRKPLFKRYPPKYIYVHSERQLCGKNGVFIDEKTGKKMSSASCYCWFIWEKGFTGEPRVRWI